MDIKKNKKVTDRTYYLFALKIIGDFGIAIAAPVVIFVLVGQWLDNKYEKRPLFTIIAFVIAAVISARMVYKKAKIYKKEYQEIIDREKRDKNN